MSMMTSPVAGSSKALMWWKQKNGGVYRGMDNRGEKGIWPTLMENGHLILGDDAAVLPINDVK